MENNSIEVGDLVRFTDEFGNEKVSIVCGLNAYEMEGMLAIEGSYGCYVRSKDEVEKVEEEHGK